MATSQWKPAKNLPRYVKPWQTDGVKRSELSLRSHRHRLLHRRYFTVHLRVGVFAGPLFTGGALTSSAGYIKLFMRRSHRSRSRRSKGNISGIVLGSPAPRYLFQQSAAAPGNTHKHAHLDHAALDKSALKGARLRHGEHEVFVRNEREKEKRSISAAHRRRIRLRLANASVSACLFLVINPFYTPKLAF